MKTILKSLNLKKSFQYNSKFFYSKVVSSADEAVKDIKSGDTVCVGGFGICGIPENLLKSLSNRTEVKDLHIVSTNGGTPTWGIGLLMQTNQIKRLTASYVGENKLLQDLYFSGQIELHFTPQGTLAEKLRSGGMGIPAYYTPTGANTFVEDGRIPVLLDKNDPKNVLEYSPVKPTKMFNNKKYLLVDTIRSDFSLIKAQKADTEGNLIFNKTARNFNKDMAQSGKITIAEVEEIVEKGELDPDEIHCPGIFVKRVVLGKDLEKRLENKRHPGMKSRGDDPKKKRIARRAAEECKSGMYVNLGIGIPNLITDFLSDDCKVSIHTENGMLGVGPYPEYGKEDPDLITAIKEACSETPGCSYFGSSESFSMVRGRHIDLTFLGSLEIDEKGNLSNWIIPGKLIKGMGGAMDLVGANGRVIVVMEHQTKTGATKILKQCALPYTGKRVVSKLITDLGVFDFINGEMILTELYSDVTLEHIKKCTEATFKVSPNLRTINY